jgi:hypothetical protein
MSKINDELECLIQRVADKYCSEKDRKNFEMTGDIQIEEALNGKFIKNKSSVSDSEHWGGAEVKMFVEIASLIAGTVKAYWEIRKLRSNCVVSDRLKEMVTIWKEKLINEGVNPEKAENVVTDFQKDIESIFI